MNEQLELVPETDETATQTPEVEKTEESETETTTTGEAEKPTYYTPEEIEDILASDGELDSKRLSPEGRLLQRSFQKGLTPKLQERSELKKRLEELEKRVQPQRPATIDEAYDQDPHGTLSYIDSEIAKARTKIKDDPLAAIDEIEGLRTVRDRLRDRDLTATKNQIKVNEIVDDVRSEVLGEIPDFDERADKLSDFAMNRLGYSLQEVQKFSDPMAVGKMAKTFISMVNQKYEMENASKTLPKKEVRTVPKTESPGKGELDSLNATYAQAVKKAQKTGDWTEVLNLKGVIKKLTPEG